MHADGWELNPFDSQLTTCNLLLCHVLDLFLSQTHRLMRYIPTSRACGTYCIYRYCATNQYSQGNTGCTNIVHPRGYSIDVVISHNCLFSVSKHSLTPLMRHWTLDGMVHGLNSQHPAFIGVLGNLFLKNTCHFCSVHDIHLFLV